MPLWPLVAPVLRYALSNVDFRFVYDRLTASRVRRLPRTRAYVADALNALLPEAKATWTPQSLFLFIAAFAKVHAREVDPMRVAWIRDPEAIVAYILRGISPGAAGTVEVMLLEECGEVFETLAAIAPHARAETTTALAPALRLGPRLYAQTVGRVRDQQRSSRDRRISVLLASALLHGGLSTNECRALLLSHDIAARDVDAALQSPERSIGG